MSTLTKMMMRRSMMASPCEPQHWRKQQSLHDLHRQICTFDDQDCPDEGLLDSDWNDGDAKAGHDSYLTPHQVSKGMIPWWRTWRKERWLNFFFSTKKTESHLDGRSRKTISWWWQHNGQISHVKNLGGIENPGHHEGSLCFGAVRVVHWLASQAVGEH